MADFLSEPAKRTALEALKKKALEGNLRQGELDSFRRRKRDDEDSTKSFLTKLRNLRMRGNELKTMPPKVISLLDAAIAILKNEKDSSKVNIS